MRKNQTCQMARKRTPWAVHVARFLLDVCRNKQLFENTLAIGNYSISRFCCCEVDMDLPIKISFTIIQMKHPNVALSLSSLAVLPSMDQYY